VKIDSRSSGYEFFTVDYLALAVAMCAVASALVLVFGAWKQSQFMKTRSGVSDGTTFNT